MPLSDVTWAIQASRFEALTASVFAIDSKVSVDLTT